MTTVEEHTPAPPSLAVRAERSISWLTLGIGGLCAAATALLRNPAEGIGVAVGTALAWINFRWLKQAADALVPASIAQAGAERPRVSVWVYVRFLLRYVLVAFVLYVMMTYFDVPAVSVVAGLLSLGAAAIARSVFEIIVRPR
jgi:hypothetical protein